MSQSKKKTPAEITHQIIYLVLNLIAMYQYSGIYLFMYFGMKKYYHRSGKNKQCFFRNTGPVCMHISFKVIAFWITLEHSVVMLNFNSAVV